MKKKARIIAFYLPQFHPIKENDEWWGKGFTEWTNVGKAKPLFRGHYQPRVPADLGYYDLRLPIIREQQAEMAREAGIEGFCYWHYWFGNGRTLLKEIFEEVLSSGKPDFPFCLGWANHSWSRRTWNSNAQYTQDVDLMKQEYPGEEDIIMHFNDVLPAFKDSRYITVDGKPLFVIYEPLSIPNPKHFFTIWNDLAVKNGLKGVHFVAFSKVWIEKSKEPLQYGFDGIAHSNQWHAEYKVYGGKFVARVISNLNQKYPKYFPALRVKYKKIIKHLIVDIDKEDNIYPVIIPQWDRSPRSAKRGVIYHESTPSLFYKHVCDAVDIVKDKIFDHRLIFLRSWNEWAESNYVEPDLRYGHGYLDAIKKAVSEDENS